MLKPIYVLTIFLTTNFISSSSLWARTRELRSQQILEDNFRAPRNWHQQDYNHDFILGISSERAYEDFPQITDGKDIVVAVIDSGIDVNHDDLIGKIWINKGEIPNNNIDDDNNGYVDDVMGWNFLGNTKGSLQFEKMIFNSEADGQEVSYSIVPGKIEWQVYADILSITREYIYLSHIPSHLRTTKQEKTINDNSKIIEQKVKRGKKLFLEFELDEAIYLNSLNALSKLGINKDSLSLEKLQAIYSTDHNVINAKMALIDYTNQGVDLTYLREQKELYQTQYQVHYNIHSNIRQLIVGDDEDNLDERFYGNNNILPASNTIHGTHVAGIIAANRLNQSAMMGIAQKIKIMPIRAIPDGDERDKDIINAIYYAVNNGAQIINMSFGKYFSAHYEKVQEALKYAHKKNVLIIQAAGNDYLNIDEKTSYPNPFINGKKLENYITVAATTPYFDDSLISNFSNFGKQSVDILAPGSYIFSTIPKNQYATMSGTSMAAPMVSAIAAVLLSQKRPFQNAMSTHDLRNLIFRGMTDLKSHLIHKPGLNNVPVENIIKWPGVVNLRESLRIMEDEYSKRNIL